MPQIDIHSTVLTAVIIMGVAVVLTLIFGIRNIIKSRKVPFFRKRHDRMMKGWRMIIIAALLIPLTWAVLNYSEPIIYSYISPSPTRTQTPTITLTPSITLTPTITLSPTITDTPSITSTPSLPGEIEDLFESEITPNPDAVFSPIEFSQHLGDDLLPRDPAVEFVNPVGHLFGSFS